MPVSEKLVQNILEVCQAEVEGNLYVKCSEHPCGWDLIDISYLEDIHELIENSEISNGVYDSHPYADKTLFEIITLVGVEGYALAPPTICPNSFKNIGI